MSANALRFGSQKRLRPDDNRAQRPGAAGCHGLRGQGHLLVRLCRRGSDGRVQDPVSADSRGSGRHAVARFSIAGSDGTWYAATAAINGSTVELTSPSVTTPAKVAYACWINPSGANLYNRDGLPANPFYVDPISARVHRDGYGWNRWIGQPRRRNHIP